jgi:hypothetical protein
MTIAKGTFDLLNQNTTKGGLSSAFIAFPCFLSSQISSDMEPWQSAEIFIGLSLADLAAGTHVKKDMVMQSLSQVADSL